MVLPNGKILFVLAVVYFIPSYIALKYKHPKAMKVVLINLLTGLTVIGWVYALILALDDKAN